METLIKHPDVTSQGHGVCVHVWPLLRVKDGPCQPGWPGRCTCKGGQIAPGLRACITNQHTYAE